MRHHIRLAPALLLVLGTVLPMVTSASAQMVTGRPMGAAIASQAANSSVSVSAFEITYCGKNGMPESLPGGSNNADLHVVGPCVVDGKLGHAPGDFAGPGATYHYHWIFIHKGGSLTFSDAKLDLYASSILVLNGGILKAGEGSEDGAIGAKGGVVTIHLWGGKDAASPLIKCEDESGQQDPMCGIDKAVWDSNKMDMAKMYPTSCSPNPQDPQGDCFYQYNPDPDGSYFG